MEKVTQYQRLQKFEKMYKAQYKDQNPKVRKDHFLSSCPFRFVLREISPVT